MGIEENLAKIQADIEEITGEGLFSSKQKVKLIAVSKYASNEQIETAYHLGLRAFGENYVAPAIKRREELNPALDIEWHLTGNLQKNKVNKAVGAFSMIQSVDSLELAEKISERSKNLGITQDLLLQVNISGEESKSGFSKELLISNFETIHKLPSLRVSGLMTMATKEGEDTETIFDEMSQLKRYFSSLYALNTFHLSMGMSRDYKVAIQKGATMIRIGRALFGV